LISSPALSAGLTGSAGCGGGILSAIGSAGGCPLTGTHGTGNSSAANIAPSHCPQTQPLNLASQRPSHYNVELLRGISGGGGVNSKSLPNIPSAMVRKDKGGCHVGRKSPPTSVSASGATKQMLVRRSKSSAILPLRKHLIEKTLAEQQQKASAEKEANNLVIKPIEEVMEEDIITTSSHKIYNNDLMMEVDMDSNSVAPVRHSFAARLGHAGLSPLVIGKVGTWNWDGIVVRFSRFWSHLKMSKNVVWVVAPQRLKLNGALRSKKFQTTLILAFKANSALSRKNETKIVKIIHSAPCNQALLMIDCNRK
jgi:hypothetical protein